MRVKGMRLAEMDQVHTYQAGEGDPLPDLPVSSIWQMLLGHRQGRPTKTALVGLDVATGEEQVFSYQDLVSAIVRCANYLFAEYGVRAQGSFGFAYDNRAEVLVLGLAGALLGAASVPLDTRRDVVDRIEYKLRLAHSRVLFTHPCGSHRESWWRKVQQFRDRVPDVQVVRFGGGRSLLDEIARYPSEPQFPVAEGLDHVHVTLFTSGTTADPKGAQLTSANLLYNALAIRRWLRITDRDRFAVLLPLHHVNSTTFSLATLLAGGTLVVLSEPPREQFWELMAKYQVTITSLVQKIVYQLLETQDRFEPVRGQVALSRVQIGSDVVDPQAAEAFIDRFGVPLHQGYGLTEIALRATGVPMGLPRADYLSLVRRNSIGAPLAGVNVSILDEDGQQAGPGEKGEICVRGPTVMRGYLRNPEATARAFQGGWFHTGDLGWHEVLYDRPFFFYHSRAKEIIKKGGSLISPAAIDRAVRETFPELEDACSFGYPSKDWGEDIWMAVTFKADVHARRREIVVDEIVTWGRREQIPGLPKFEAPSRIVDWDALFPGHPIPRTATMKTQRARLKELVLARFPPADERPD
jgi:acyl-CoA synthetase (AMP-forming)/AMP-acid ligase II